VPFYVFFYVLFYVNFMIEFINMIYFLNKRVHHFKMALYSIKSYFVGMYFLFCNNVRNNMLY